MTALFAGLEPTKKKKKHKFDITLRGWKSTRGSYRISSDKLHLRETARRIALASCSGNIEKKKIQLMHLLIAPFKKCFKYLMFGNVQLGVACEWAF